MITVCADEHKKALESAARDSLQWRNSIERVVDWLASKENALAGLRRLSCDLDNLREQSRICEASVSLFWSYGLLSSLCRVLCSIVITCTK
jgi:hypothetical protein